MFRYRMGPGRCCWFLQDRNTQLGTNLRTPLGGHHSRYYSEAQTGFHHLDTHDRYHMHTNVPVHSHLNRQTDRKITTKLTFSMMWMCYFIIWYNLAQANKLESVHCPTWRWWEMLPITELSSGTRWTLWFLIQAFGVAVCATGTCLPVKVSTRWAVISHGTDLTLTYKTLHHTS